MKYLCVIGGFSCGGAERVMTNIVNYLSEIGDVVFVGVKEYPDPAYSITPKARIVNGLNGGSKVQDILALRRLLRAEKPDVVLSFMTQINIATLLAAWGLHIPVVISERCDPSQTPGKGKRILRNILYPLCKGAVFQTDDAMKYFPNLISRSTVIANPVYVSSDDKEYMPTERKHEIVGVGRLDKQKNFPLLIDAFSQIADQFPDYNLKIYGEGPLRECLETYIRSKNLVDRVELCGQSQKLHANIRDASIFVLSSDYEGMPNALMEAMTLGIPSISTDCPVGGPRTLIDNGNNGILVIPNDVDMLAKELSRLLEQPHFAEKIARNAKRSMENYDVSVVMKQWDSYLKSKVM